MVEVYVVVPSQVGDNYYAELTGRWYLSPSGVLWVEVAYIPEDAPTTWFGKQKYMTFVTEESIREIQGEIVYD